MMRTLWKQMSFILFQMSHDRKLMTAVLLQLLMYCSLLLRLLKESYYSNNLCKGTTTTTVILDIYLTNHCGFNNSLCDGVEGNQLKLPVNIYASQVIIDNLVTSVKCRGSFIVFLMGWYWKTQVLFQKYFNLSLNASLY